MGCAASSASGAKIPSGTRDALADVDRASTRCVDGRTVRRNVGPPAEGAAVDVRMVKVLATLPGHAPGEARSARAFPDGQLQTADAAVCGATQPPASADEVDAASDYLPSA
uniref:Uncharacterized protein n=1 Tax=Neobodo designis TaxID=312471 RepID=A0A7S1Q7C6_NEODS|mmetsp:Transcript_35262/g.108842  ORF Transcript_35262/g.108842 Transcript_35262/m.108842 type:complete len:111 (+) Transcript_35262:126-458(+)